MKNLKHKREIIVISGYKSYLADKFIKKYKKKYKFIKYNKDINDYNLFDIWIKKNKNLNYFINFAALIGSSSNKRNEKKLYQTNFHSVIKITEIINLNKLKKFKYFLALSSSHISKIKPKTY